MVPTGTSIMLDSLPVNGFIPVADGFSLARLLLDNSGDGNHYITGSAPFGISVYGYGQYTSYWYPGGLNLDTIIID
ncbi:MAG: hypothetical protein GY811_25720 [Myxococcales bacterium]|nr:hypothetical protein [Myxococcales bacterium]